MSADRPRAPHDRLTIGGVHVDNVTMAEAVECIATFVQEGRDSGTTFQVVTVNVDFVVNATRDPALADVMRRADLCVPDGMPLVWGGRLLGTPMRSRVTGADLVPELARWCAAHDASLYFLGGRAGSAEAAADLLQRSHPGVRIVADSSVSVQKVDEPDEQTIASIRATKADIVCVGFGNPKQEWWIHHHRAAIGAPVYIGVGGTFDLLVGETRRAPAWMQRAGLEWVFRTITEPRRLARRYARDIAVFGPMLAREVFASWRSRRTGAALPSAGRGEGLSQPRPNPDESS